MSWPKRLWGVHGDLQKPPGCGAGHLWAGVGPDGPRAPFNLSHSVPLQHEDALVRGSPHSGPFSEELGWVNCWELRVPGLLRAHTVHGKGVLQKNEGKISCSPKHTHMHTRSQCYTEFYCVWAFKFSTLYCTNNLQIPYTTPACKNIQINVFLVSC